MSNPRGQKPARGKTLAKMNKKAAKKGGVDDDREESLQAVVLADSFETRFMPFALEKPRCLLPLANTPLIEYTLEFLAMSGVSQIYIYCGAHTGEVERYINASKWHPQSSPTSPFLHLEILKSGARSVGDALRDIDNRGLITGDFLLVHGDLISNLPINAALSRHRARRQADKNAIMTLILRAAGSGDHRTKSHGVTPVFVVDPTKSRCVHYEELNPLQASKYVSIDPVLLSEHTELEIRSDLIDCGIDICTPDVLALWSESFDYEVPRRHFLHGVLKDYELNGKTIHTEVITDHYAARVNNLQSYESVSKDILGRWAYPLVPDSNLVSGQSYKVSQDGIYRESGVSLARTCKIENRTVLGKGTSVGDGTVISHSIIGRGCQIGKNVTISNAFIWDDAVVGDGTEIHRAIIANEVVLGKNCYVEPGSLLSFGTRIADGFTVNSGTRITRAKRKREDYDQEVFESVPTDPDVVGEGGDGYLFFDEDEDYGDDEALLQSNLIYSTADLNLSSSSISTMASAASGYQSPSAARSRLSSFTGSLSDDDMAATTGTSGENFHKDAVADVFKTLSEGGDFHNTRVEFTSLRLSNNASDHQMHRAIAVAFMKRIAQLIDSGLEPSKATLQTFDQEGAVPFLSDVAIGREKSLEDQVDFLVSVQKDLIHRDKGDIVLFAVCRELYDREVLEEEGFETWWTDDRSTETDEMKKVRGTTEAFMTWLREADEEDSEEEEDEDSE